MMSIFNVRDFGAVGDGKTDDSLAFATAIAAMPTPDGFTIYVPWGTYRLESDWVIDRGVNVVGAHRLGSVLAFAAGTSMRFNSLGVRTVTPISTVKQLWIRCEKLPVGDWQRRTPYSVGDLVYGTLSYGSQRNGFHYRCSRPGTSDAFRPPNWGSANHSGATVGDGPDGLEWTAVSSPCIYSSRPVHIEDVYAEGATDSGIHLEGSDALHGSCNSSVITYVYCANNGGHGVHIIGGEAQGCCVENSLFTGNGGYAIADQGFFSNVLKSNLAEANAYAYLCNNGADDAGKPSLWLGNYVETGQGPSTLISPCIYLGGSSDLSGFDSNTNATVEAEGLFKNMSIDTSEIQLLLGKAVYPSLARDVYGFRESSSPFIHSLSFDRIEQAFQLIWANSTANAIAYEITGYLNEDGRNLLRFPDGIWIGRGTSRRRFVIRSAMPSDTDPTSPVSRLWRQGDRIYHDDPVPGGPEGWVCTATGGWGGGSRYTARTFASGLIVSPGDAIEPTTSTGYVYRAKSLAGGAYALTTSTEPTWPTSIGATVTDSAGIMWECFGAVPPVFKTFGSIST